ncbi:asparagine synthase (glutamine-hydrolyzing) [Lutibacter flavus]|uniref:asparagine synthase (glutamine-hydrolyzing) n=1 Tax=Lutibacter flavus TaxID=691689 RepID=A0A238YYT4_9FLAO|nr:asparagine synthase (glutamine-hydrolyzing) [Lutibacter flavus]SNR76142.1 asparagine synthase (glutamine-hydrolysing) [Lutibacter flavus]
MCGITGFISTEKIDFKYTLKNMINELIHRGPDDQGFWIDEEEKVGLGHTRLSILDLSQAGHQPMISKSERYVIVFNGEIYNHLSIRSEIDTLEKVNWKGHSDTETLLSAIEIWGIEQTLNKCVGMFAFALWDKIDKSLLLARDRMGEKPLYYGWVNNNFVFGSELKSIKRFTGFKNEIDRNSLALYLRYSSIPEPYSIYENINKLESGCYLTYDYKQRKIRIKNYYSIEKISNQSCLNEFSLNDVEAVSKLESLLMDSVGLQMQADVPTGAFLSGGVDSTIIVALMQAQSKRKINTFSIGFEQKDYNEAEHARSVSKYLGTDHYDLYVSGQEVLDVIPLLPNMYCEPFSDSSQIPTYLVSKIAKEKVTVCLTGDAGDELFCGYNRYNLANKSWNKISKIPMPLRSMLGFGINAIPYDIWELLFQPFKKQNKKSQAHFNKLDKFLKASLLLNSKNRKDFYHKGFMSHNNDVENWVLKSKLPKTIFELNDSAPSSYFSEMMKLDLMSYLPNDNLVKVDRAAMEVSLETRVPLLDHRIVEFALNLPLEFKLRDGVNKWILREVLYKHVPKKLIDRPKMGFAVPLASWLRGPLKDWGENLLNEKKLIQQGYFNATIIRRKWEEHISGKRNWHYQLWDVLIFQSWLNEQ